MRLLPTNVHPHVPSVVAILQNDGYCGSLSIDDVSNVSTFMPRSEPAGAFQWLVKLSRSPYALWYTGLRVGTESSGCMLFCNLSAVSLTAQPPIDTYTAIQPVFPGELDCKSVKCAQLCVPLPPDCPLLCLLPCRLATLLSVFIAFFKLIYLAFPRELILGSYAVDPNIEPLI